MTELYFVFMSNQADELHVRLFRKYLCVYQ